MPWADLIYACDKDWWHQYYLEVKVQCSGKMWTQDKEAAQIFDINYCESDTSGRGLGRNGIINTGGNSGYQAINLVYFLGATHIVLLGYDMQRTKGKSHWHGDHPGGLNRSSSYHSWIKKYRDLAKDLKNENIECVNASRETALDCFPRVNLKEYLK